MTRVLIAVDGTDIDARVSAAARALFGDAAEYWAMSATDPGPPPSQMTIGLSAAYGGAVPYPISPPDEDRVQQLLERAATRAQERTSGIDATTVGAVGDPAEAILKAAVDHEIEVIVVGTHHRGWLARLFEPSVSAEVLEHATVPVLVVPGAD